MSDAVAPATIPVFARGVKLRFDAARDAWVVLAPERMFVPDPPALAVLQLIDGARSVAAIVADLAARFAAPAEVIAADVAAMLDDLAAKGVLRL